MLTFQKLCTLSSWISEHFGYNHDNIKTEIDIALWCYDTNIYIFVYILFQQSVGMETTTILPDYDFFFRLGFLKSIHSYKIHVLNKALCIQTGNLRHIYLHFFCAIFLCNSPNYQSSVMLPYYNNVENLRFCLFFHELAKYFSVMYFLRDDFSVQIYLSYSGLY